MSRENIKSKVIIGFSSAILLGIATIYIVFISFTDLMSSINYLARPDFKITKLNIMLAEIAGTENSMRSYAVTLDKQFLKSYYKHFHSVQQSIDSLKILTENDAVHNPKIHALDQLWHEKEKDFVLLATLYKKKPQHLSKYVLRNISSLSLDSAQVKVTMDTTTTMSFSDIESTLNDKTPKKKEGMFTFIKKIFTKKDSTIVAKASQRQPQVTSNRHVTVNTDSILSFSNDSAIHEVIKKISAMEQKESRLADRLSKRELEILEKNMAIFNHVTAIIFELRKEQMQQRSEKLAKAESTADRSTAMLASIAALGLLSTLFFTWRILRDVSKSNYYKKELLQSKKEAEKLAKVKDEFLSNMSHEIRTPLNSVIGYADQLSPDAFSNKQQVFLNAIKSSSEHLSSIVNNILDLSKMEHGKLLTERIPFSPKEVIEEIYENQKYAAAEKELHFFHSMPELHELSLIGDPLRLKQMLLNLVSNAIKFTAHGSVGISWEAKLLNEKMSEIIIRVQDTGIGIEKDKQAMIFESFSQTDSSTTRKYGGTGLGLAITKKIVKLLHGNIKVESVPGKGSVFTLRLHYEVRQTSTHEKAIAITTPDTEILQGKKILIAEDDELNLLLLHTILKKWHLHVRVAANGKEAFEMILQEDFDLILTDMHMPEMNGFSLAEAIRSLNDTRKSSVPILMVTANVMKDEFQEQLDSMINGYLFKPYKELALFEKIIDVLSINRADLHVDQHLKNEPSSEPLTNIYSIHELKKFSGSDSDSLQHILRTLVTNSTYDIRALNLACDNKNRTKTAAIAHKMSSSFAHLQAKQICEDLNTLQSCIGRKCSDETMIRLVQKITLEAQQTLEMIRNELLEKKTEPEI